MLPAAVLGSVGDDAHHFVACHCHPPEFRWETIPFGDWRAPLSAWWGDVKCDRRMPIFYFSLISKQSAAVTRQKLKKSNADLVHAYCAQIRWLARGVWTSKNIFFFANAIYRYFISIFHRLFFLLLLLYGRKIQVQYDSPKMTEAERTIRWPVGWVWRAQRQSVGTYRHCVRRHPTRHTCATQIFERGPHCPVSIFRFYIIEFICVVRIISFYFSLLCAWME